MDTRQINSSLWPLVVAHRGDTTNAPENTLAAFQSALSLGVDGIELDVRLSADGMPIVIHDEFLERTTNGTGPVSSLTTRQLKLLQIRNPLRHSSGYERIATLEEAIESISTEVEILIEMKGNNRRLARSVAETIAKCYAFQHCMVISFAPGLLVQFRKLDDSTRTGLLIGADDAWITEGRTSNTALNKLIEKLQPDCLLPHYSLLDDELMDLVSQSVVDVGTWTVDESSLINRMINLGVSRLVTNRPELALSIRQRLMPTKDTKWT